MLEKEQVNHNCSSDFSQLINSLSHKTVLFIEMYFLITIFFSTVMYEYIVNITFLSPTKKQLHIF